MVLHKFQNIYVLCKGTTQPDHTGWKCIVGERKGGSYDKEPN